MKNRLTMMNMLIMLMLAVFTFSTTHAQEAKEEVKVVKIKVMTDDEGNVTVDTSFVMDEEMLEKLEEMDIQIDVDGDENVFIMKSPHTSKKGYYYATSTDGNDSETHVEVRHIEEDIIIDVLDGDTTITVIMNANNHAKECNKKVMVWHGDDDHKAHSEMVFSDEMDMDVEMEIIDGDTIIKYTITMDGEEHEHSGDMMFWTSDEGDMEEHDFIIKSAEGNVMMVEMFDDEASTIITQTIIISNIDDGEKEMLSEAGMKFGNDELLLHDFTIGMENDSENIKVSFEVLELKNVAIYMLNGIGNQIYLEELKTLAGKYIREIEIPEGAGEYYFHVKAGKKSVTHKISLD